MEAYLPLNGQDTKNECYEDIKALKPMSCFQHHHLNYYGNCEKEIGDGTFGKVLKYVSEDSKRVAVKIHEANTSTFREIVLMEECQDSPYIVDLIDVGYDPRHQKFYQVMPLAKCNIYDKIQDDYFYDQPERIRKVIFNVLQALAHLHTKNYIHRDIKPENILLYSDGEYKLCDFGLSRKANLPGDSYTSYMVTLFYRPPENLCGFSEYDKSIDIWSLGCIFIELITGFPAFEFNSSQEVLKKQLAALSIRDQVSQYPDYLQKRIRSVPSKFCKRAKKWWCDKIQRPIVEKMGENVYDLIMNMLRLDPSERISARNALMHPFFEVFEPISVPIVQLHVLYQPQDWRERFDNKVGWNHRNDILLRAYTIARENGLSSFVILKSYFLFNKFMNLTKPEFVSAGNLHKYIRVILNVVSKTDSCYVLNLSTISTKREKSSMKKCRLHFLHTIKFNLIMRTGYEWFWEPRNLQKQETITPDSLDHEELYEISRSLYKITLFIPEIFFEYRSDIVAEACQTYILKENGVECRITDEQHQIHGLITEHFPSVKDKLSKNKLFREEVLDNCDL